MHVNFEIPGHSVKHKISISTSPSTPQNSSLKLSLSLCSLSIWTKWPLCERNLSPHISHLNGSSPVWTCLCSCKFFFLLITFLQSRHLCSSEVGLWLFLMSIILLLHFVFSLTSGVGTFKLFFHPNAWSGGWLILIEMEIFYCKHCTWISCQNDKVCVF